MKAAKFEYEQARSLKQIQQAYGSDPSALRLMGAASLWALC